MLLMTAASGAWAEEVTIGDPTSTLTDEYLPSYSTYEYSITQQIYTADEIGMSGTITTLTMWLTNTSYYARNFNVYMKEVSGSVFEDGDSWVSLSEDDLVGTATINNDVSDPTETTFTLETPFEYSGTGNLLICIHDITGEWSSGLGGVFFSTESNQSLHAYKDDTAYDISYPGDTGFLLNIKNVVRLDIEESGLEVNTNAEEGETFFTEAWFTMPTFDATVDYDIVRDMADTDNPVEFSGLSPKVVVKKKTDSDAYEPLSELNIQLIDQLAATDAQNIIAADGIKVKVLKGTDNNGTITYDETNPIEYDDFLDDMQPGLYKIVAEPTDATTSPYIGTASLAFQTLTGYPVEVAAHGFVTYYSDENLKLSDESTAGVLYTITNVSGNTATATEIEIANAGMPFIIRNTSDEKQTFLLIPTENEINMSVYPGFKGTLEGKTFTAAEMAATDHYVINRQQFVWVKDPIAVGPNKAWLSVATSNARTLKLVYDDATAISEKVIVNSEEFAPATWYDLNGRKLDGAPTKKGVYILNGKKVVVK